jgi:hypothetical protein
MSIITSLRIDAIKVKHVNNYKRYEEYISKQEEKLNIKSRGKVQMSHIYICCHQNRQK